MTIGQRIKYIREQHGMSVEELAQKIGKSRATLYRYENDETVDIPVNIFPLLSKTFAIHPAYFMGWTDDAGIYVNPQVGYTGDIFSVTSYTEDNAVSQTTIYTKNKDTNQIVLRAKNNEIDVFDLDDLDFATIKQLCKSLQKQND